jgi:hypothetical protein
MNIDNVNRNNYIYELEQARKSLELLQKKGNFNSTEILLMLILGVLLDKAEYEAKEQEE